MHDLDLTSGQAAIAWSGNVPWHGLGQRLHSTWFGAGARTKQAALQAAMEFVK